MEMSLMKVLLSHISSFFHLSTSNNINSEPAMKYFHEVEEMLKLLKPVVDAIIDSKLASDESLNKAFEELINSISRLRELHEKWQPVSSKVYSVMQIEELMLKIRKSNLDIFQFLLSSHDFLPVELTSTHLEHDMQKIQHMDLEQVSSAIKDALRSQVNGNEPSSGVLVEIAEALGFSSNLDILIEVVALEKLKENAELAERAEEAEFIGQIVALVTDMRERLAVIKQSQSCSPVQIPTDFCCPLSLELMTDPVIVSSGQTYERAFIKTWIDLGFTVCPKTRQALVHTNLIPNYTVKALIANWCETKNVKLPDPTKLISLNEALFQLRGLRSDREPHQLPYFTGSEPLLPESQRSSGSPARSRNSSICTLQEGTLFLPRSPPEESSSVATANGLGLDAGTMSLADSEDGLAELEENVGESVGRQLACPSRTDLPRTIGVALPHVHNRAASDSSMYRSTNSHQGMSEDTTEASCLSNALSGYSSSDGSGDVKSQPPVSVNSNIPQREVELPPRLEVRSRSQTIWRRPPDRFGSRIVSSPVFESRPDLSEVEARVRNLVEDLKSTSLDTVSAATAELRLLAKHNMDNRIVVASCGAIACLVDLLCSTDPSIQENAVTALLNLSINDNNKITIAQANAIEPLIHVLETGSPEAKENSAATLFSLSVIEANKVKIGRSGAIVPLVDLLGNGTPRGKKDAATALFNLSILHENKTRIVQAGAVKHLVELTDPAAGMVDKAVAVLANLATIPEGRTSIGVEGGIPVLVDVVELGSARGKENAAAALLQLCTNSNRYCSMVLQEGAVPPLVALSQFGTPRAKEKAQALLSYFRSHRHGNAGRA